MKVAHFAIVTPNRCGLYETTREIVKALRDSGIDSRIFDPRQESNDLHPGGYGDRGALFCTPDWVDCADVFVSHSGVGEWETTHTQPIIYVAHRRPKNSFVFEEQGKTPIYSYYNYKNKDKRFSSVVTLWGEHLPYLNFMFPDIPVKFVPPCVDLDYWTPGPKEYDFSGESGSINVVITDSWRDDADNFVPLNAVGTWARNSKKDVKVHVYAVPKMTSGMAALFKRLKNDGTLGLVQEWASDLRRVYRAADVAVTTHSIDTRTVREATACGCPVVKFPTLDISNADRLIDTALGISRDQTRLQAKGNFSLKRTATEFIKVLEDAVSQTKHSESE